MKSLSLPLLTAWPMSNYSGVRYSRARYGYEDELETGGHGPHSRERGARKPLLGGVTEGSKGYSRLGEYDDEEAPKASVGPSLWGRTLLVGLVFFALGAFLCGVLLYWYIWVALPMVFVYPWFVCYLAPMVFSCCYPQPTETEKAVFDTKRPMSSLYPWVITVRNVAFWALLFGGMVGVSGGYFMRELYFVQTGGSYAKLSTTAPPKRDIGTITSFANNGKPNGNAVGRTVGFGVLPVCVAPIVESANQKIVSYWALSTGVCCTHTPADCYSFDKPAGGTILKNQYLEFFPNTEDAIKDAVKVNGLLVDDTRIFLHRGNPDEHISELRGEIASV